jgi:hypothetical protein
MISRIWHGWTSPENADVYESLLKNEIFTGISNREIADGKFVETWERYDTLGFMRQLGVIPK